MSSAGDASAKWAALNLKFIEFQSRSCSCGTNQPPIHIFAGKRVVISVIQTWAGLKTQRDKDVVPPKFNRAAFGYRYENQLLESLGQA